MSYHHCRNGHHDECNGYVGPLDSFTCLCPCHGEWDERGRRTARRGHGASEGDPSL